MGLFECLANYVRSLFLWFICVHARHVHPYLNCVFGYDLCFLYETDKISCVLNKHLLFSRDRL